MGLRIKVGEEGRTKHGGTVTSVEGEYLASFTVELTFININTHFCTFTSQRKKCFLTSFVSFLTYSRPPKSIDHKLSFNFSWPLLFSDHP